MFLNVFKAFLFLPFFDGGFWVYVLISDFIFIPPFYLLYISDTMKHGYSFKRDLIGFSGSIGLVILFVGLFSVIFGEAKLLFESSFMTKNILFLILLAVYIFLISLFQGFLLAAARNYFVNIVWEKMGNRKEREMTK